MILSYDMILENFVRTENKQTENRQTENSKPEATLIPMDCRGERANILDYFLILISAGTQHIL